MNADLQTTNDDPFVGRIIEGRYQIVEKLGEGGMGAVYEAEQLALNRRVALKVIHTNFAGDGEVRARFAREATASGQLDGHPHVATALDFGTLPDGELFLVMQLVRGPSLRDVIDHAPLAWDRALFIGTQIADALSAAHARGIIHRDLKPDNVSLVRREDGREIAKVLDFGIARVVDDAKPELSDTKLTRVGTIMGTPGYMAPEQAVGDAVDERADLYALGVVLFEMITGKLPFDGPDLTSIVARQFAETPAEASKVIGDATVPPELDSLICSLLARVPIERPATATEVLHRLEAIGRATTASDTRPPRNASERKRTPPLPPEVMERATAAVITVRSSVEAVLPPKAKRYALPLVAAAVGLPLLVLLVALFSRGVDPNAPNPLVAIPSPIIGSEPRPILSPELTAAVQTLVEIETRNERSEAADLVLAAKDDPAMPPYAVQLAELESARGCRAKQNAVNALAELADERALPPLERLAATPRRGCGFLSSKDCNACLRSDLDAAIEKLRDL